MLNWKKSVREEQIDWATICFFSLQWLFCMLLFKGTVSAPSHYRGTEMYGEIIVESLYRNLFFAVAPYQNPRLLLELKFDLGAYFESLSEPVVAAFRLVHLIFEALLSNPTWRADNPHLTDGAIFVAQLVVSGILLFLNAWFAIICLGILFAPVMFAYGAVMFSLKKYLGEESKQKVN